ncbi:adhesion G protein-coupled receptor E2-like [Ciona intestinalis]
MLKYSVIFIFMLVLISGTAAQTDPDDASFLISFPTGVNITALLEGLGLTLTDNDECDRLTPVCHEFASCINTLGSYECSCKDGFRSENATLDKNELVCLDINECVENLHFCDITTTYCQNTNGFFQCQCLPGYEQSDISDNSCNGKKIVICKKKL